VDLGFFPENPMSKSEPCANEVKKMSRGAGVAVKAEQQDEPVL
jgi:hypothetical protein